MDYKMLGLNVKKYRKFRDLTQEGLAETIDVSAVFMSQIENAKGKPSLETIVNIANTLEVSLDTLVGTDINAENNRKYIKTSLDKKQMKLITDFFANKTDEEITRLFRAFEVLLEA